MRKSSTVIFFSIVLISSILFATIIVFTIFIDNTVVYSNNQTKLDVVINGKEVVFTDALPYINKNHRTMAPVRVMAETVGASVDWVGTTQQVIIRNKGTEVIFRVGEKGYRVNGVLKQMNTEMINHNGRTYVPIRFLMEEMGFLVKYESGKILISNSIKVYIDSGHGADANKGNYPRYPTGVYEYLVRNKMSVGPQYSTNYTSGAHREMQINWEVSNKLEKLLINDGRFLVMRDRLDRDGYALPNYQRAEVANEWGADLRISIHAERTSSLNGYFIAMPSTRFVLPKDLGGYYTDNIRDESERLAQVILKSLDDSPIQWKRINNAGIIRSDGGYIAYHFSKHPVVILEMDAGANWTNTIERESNQNAIAEALYKAIIQFAKGI